jgi:hypothetical protein
MEVMISIAYRERTIRTTTFREERKPYLCTKNIPCGAIARQLIEPQDKLRKSSSKHGARKEVTTQNEGY